MTAAASLTDLSRVVSHALRHEPWLYDLELDEAGWVEIDQLLDALHRLDDRWADVDRSTLARMIAAGDKQRHELAGDRIRAIYGHSVPGRILREPAEPPEVLYHGTDPAVLDEVLRSGLQPMRRQYVHLSPDRATAVRVGLRKARPCAVLRVDAGAASAGGVMFSRGNDQVWLADAVPPQYLQVETGTVAHRLTSTAGPPAGPTTCPATNMARCGETPPAVGHRGAVLGRRLSVRAPGPHRGMDESPRTPGPGVQRMRSHLVRSPGPHARVGDHPTDRRGRPARRRHAQFERRPTGDASRAPSPRVVAVRVNALTRTAGAPP